MFPDVINRSSQRNNFGEYGKSGQPEEDKILVKYYRLSLEEKEKGESGSIANQRRLVEDYLAKCVDLAAMTALELSDDGYTGMNFKRPGIERFFRLLRENRVGCLVVKDFSRFTRDYVELGNYAEQVFPFMGVRFISVNDRYDSREVKDEDSWLIPFKGILNNLYSRDISSKVRTAKRQMIKEGKPCSGSYPFGYRKTGKGGSEQGGMFFETDEKAAQVVRLIFRLALGGKKNREIARILNWIAIPTPAVYKQENGGFGYGLKEGKASLWDSPKILAVLRDERYTGIWIGGRHQSGGVGSGRTKEAPEDMWIRKAEGMPGIIAKEDFERVQVMRPIHRRGKYKTKHHLLYRKVKCGNCGRSLYIRRSDGRTGLIFFFCQQPRLLPGSSCFCGYVKEEDILTVIYAIIAMGHRLAGDKENKEEGQGKNVRDRESRKVLQQMRVLEREIIWEKELNARDYLGYRTGKLTEEEFQKKRNERKNP